MNEILKYAEGMNASQSIIDWIEKRTEGKEQGEVEHIIDFLVSDKAPKRLDRATYEQIKLKTEKWVQALNEEAKKIKEINGDTEVVLDFKDGFKIVKLIGKKHMHERAYLCDIV